MQQTQNEIEAALRQHVGRTVRLDNKNAREGLRAQQIDVSGVLEPKDDEGFYYVRIVDNGNGASGINFPATSVLEVEEMSSGMFHINLK